MHSDIKGSARVFHLGPEVNNKSQKTGIIKGFVAGNSKADRQ